MAEDKNKIKTSFRMSKDLHSQLSLAATASGRSMNSEIIHRLETSFSVRFTPDGYPEFGPDMTLGDLVKMFESRKKK